MIPRQREPICVLIVDDEGPARQRLADLLRSDPQVGIVFSKRRTGFWR